ncbi:ISKra4 family transposase, partial [Acaryochloris marina NIES-2412]
GIQIAAKTQQRLVHQQQFPEPQAHEALTEVSVDGGKVRIRTPAGQPCQWKDYKTLATDVGLIADYHNNARLIGWTHQQP